LAFKKFKEWLNSRNIEIFFEIVSNVPESDQKWIYRRKFWEACIPYIENTWPIFGSKILNSYFLKKLKKKKKYILAN